MVSLFLAALVCMAGGLAGAEGPVKIISVEPDSPFINPNGRLLKNRHPARFRVVLENRTDSMQRGVLAAEAAGNLGTVYHVSREAVELAAREKRLVWAIWDYPGDLVFPDLPGGEARIAGARGGHELRVAWLDAEGHARDWAGTVFAIERDGSPDGAPQPRKTEPVTPRQAFDIRYGGYLKNPAFAPTGEKPELNVTLDGRPAGGLTQGIAPSGNLAFLLRLPPSSRARPAVLTVAADGRRLAEAWLLDPEHPAGPRAARLHHLADGRQFTFTVPATGAGATLVMEMERAHRYIAPVPLAEMAAMGEQKYGPTRSLERWTAGIPKFDAAQWEARRKRLRETIRTSLHVTPEPKTTPFAPQTLSEDRLAPHGWPNGVSRAYLRRKVSIQNRSGERVNLWLLIPEGIGPFPAVVALHQTVYEGKDEPVGLGGHFHVLNFGPFLASRGFVVIAPDSPTAGERYDGDFATGYETSRQTAKDPNWSLLGERLRDHLRVVDYLETLPFVDTRRIGVIGHSLGGESATMLMAMDDRIRAAALSCGFTLLRTFEEAADTYAPLNSAILSANFRRLLLAPVKDRKLPFDFDDCMALWAARPVFQHDVKTELWPNAAQVAQAAVELKRLYRMLGAEERYYVIYSDQTHCFPSWVQPDAFDWLEYWLSVER